jgi:DivIVA domain-containing protein
MINPDAPVRTIHGPEVRGAICFEFTDRVLSFFTAGDELSRADVRNATFRPQLLGYSEPHVDALLDELVRVMLAVR